MCVGILLIGHLSAVRKGGSRRHAMGVPVTDLTCHLARCPTCHSRVFRSSLTEGEKVRVTSADTGRQSMSVRVVRGAPHHAPSPESPGHAGPIPGARSCPGARSLGPPRRGWSCASPFLGCPMSWTIRLGAEIEFFSFYFLFLLVLPPKHTLPPSTSLQGRSSPSYLAPGSPQQPSPPAHSANQAPHGPTKNLNQRVSHHVPTSSPCVRPPPSMIAP